MIAGAGAYRRNPGAPRGNRSSGKSWRRTLVKPPRFRWHAAGRVVMIGLSVATEIIDIIYKLRGGL
jgi:hypothetical protein